MLFLYVTLLTLAFLWKAPVSWAFAPACCPPLTDSIDSVRACPPERTARATTDSNDADRFVGPSCFLGTAPGFGCDSVVPC